MAEFEPGFNKAPKDERDELAQKKLEYERALFDATQKEAFGKFDVTAPNEGEDTYQSYLDQRPAEGIVRNAGDTPVDAQTNKFVAQEAYEAQKGTTQDYYDQLGGLVNNDEYEPTNYDTLGVLQLAKEAAKARQLGDPAEEATIRAALEHHLAGNALKDDTETPEQAQARYDADIARYEQLVDRLSQRGETWPPHAAEAHAEPNGEGQPSARTETDTTAVVADAAVETADAPADSQELVTTEDEAPETPDAETSTSEAANVEQAETTEPSKDEEEPATPAGATYNGKKVTVARVIPHPGGDSSKDALTVVDEDGNTFTIHASEITYSGLSASAAEAADEAKVPGTEVELYQADKKEAVAVETEEVEQEKGIKKWWGKVRDSAYRLGGAAFWAKEWAKERGQGVYSKWLDHNIDDSMGDEEKQKKRDNNRKKAIAAGAGVGILLLGGATWAIAAGIASLNDGSSAGADTTPGTGGGQGGEAARQAHLDSLRTDGTDGPTNLPLEGTPGAEVVQEAAPVGGEISAIKGEGGEALFARYEIPTSFYDQQWKLLNMFPDDFRLNPAGDGVWVSHSGPLSQGAQDAINSLR